MRGVTESSPIPLREVRTLAGQRFGDMVKGVVDLRREIVLLDADLRADQESALLAEGSRREDLWGVNLHPDLDETEWIEFVSLINLRPGSGNRSRGVDAAGTREAISTLIARLVRR